MCEYARAGRHALNDFLNSWGKLEPIPLIEANSIMSVRQPYSRRAGISAALILLAKRQLSFLLVMI